MKTNVYVDALNLYYGALKSRPACKWLDLGAVSRALLMSGQQLNRIRYFTAPVRALPGDPNAPQRQSTYLRALRTVSGLTIHPGIFKVKTVRLPLAQPPHQLVQVLKPEEKGSDVNLATYLLLDAFNQDADAAIVVSDDFDLKEPLMVVKKELGRTLGIASPRCRTWLRSAVGANFYRAIREPILSANQFPAIMNDATGTFRKPPTWV